MKKYKLLKDIPCSGHILKVEEILTNSGLYYRCSKFHIAFYKEVVEQNLDFFEEIMWRKPEQEEQYFYLIFDRRKVAQTFWNSDSVDEDRYEFGNCFLTEEQAEHARDEIKKLLLQLHEND